MSAGSLIIMARVPRAGQVKTRLAALIGDAAALDCYRALLSATLATAARLGDAVQRHLCVAGEDADGECAALADAYDCSLTHQVTGDLGQRMRAALADALDRRAPAVVIGTDCPGITEPYLRQAFDELAAWPAVIGPAEDGGYVLLGLAHMLPLFEGPRWSTASVLADTRQLLRGCGAAWLELPTLWDVDTEADYRRWRLPD